MVSEVNGHTRTADGMYSVNNKQMVKQKKQAEEVVSLPAGRIG